MSGAWILIVSFSISPGGSSSRWTHGVAMQEFSDVKACQFASLEVQKIAQATRTVCVPKATP